jgi:hypothetical protein
MNYRKCLLDVFRGTNDKLPWCADLAYWYEAENKKGTISPQYRGDDGWLKLHKDLGITIYYDYGMGNPYDQKNELLEVLVHCNDNVKRTNYKTKMGELYKVECYNYEAFCWAIKEYPVKTEADLRILQYILEGVHYDKNFDRYIEREKKLGEAGLPIVSAPRSPLPALLVDWMGVEVFTYLFVDSPNELLTIIEVIERKNELTMDILCKSPVQLIHFCDNLSAEIIGGYFDRYLREYYKKHVSAFHKNGKYCVTHLDGTMKGLLPKLADTGMDGIEALTPAPVGDIPVSELREQVRNDRTVLWGGLPGAMFSPVYSFDSFKSHLEEVLKIYAKKGRFVLGSADQIPPDADFSRMELVKEMVSRI